MIYHSSLSVSIEGLLDSCSASVLQKALNLGLTTTTE